ncbi:MAG: hypothetical protein RLZZ70_808 [Candidatus Parcubacteria bacterium]
MRAQKCAHILPDRLMVGHLVLVQGIEVRVLVGQRVEKAPIWVFFRYSLPEVSD